MTQPKNRFNNPTGTLIGYDGTNFYPVHVDSTGNLAVKTTLDFVADVEVTGTQTTNRKFAPAASGDNTLVAVAGGAQMKLFKVTVSPTSDITGNIIVKLGSTEIGGVANPMSGGQYILVSCAPDYELGADGEDLVINLPSATSVIVNATYSVV